MTLPIRKPRQDDVFGHLEPRPIAVRVRAIFGAGTRRYVVQRYHVERNVRPDPIKRSER